ncbi:hypothetical protein PMAYCL1PPCAC_06335, partial [Pristionchus mayeri]
PDSRSSQWPLPSLHLPLHRRTWLCPSQLHESPEEEIPTPSLSEAPESWPHHLILTTSGRSRRISRRRWRRRLSASGTSLAPCCQSSLALHPSDLPGSCLAHARVPSSAWPSSPALQFPSTCASPTSAPPTSSKFRSLCVRTPPAF